MAERIFPQPAPTAREQVLFIDAVEALIPAAKLQYARMKASARIITMRDSPDPPTEETIELAQTALVADTGGFIGNLQRLRSVIPRLKGDADLRLAKRAFDATMRSYEAARHHLEHLDQRIPEIAPMGRGVFGGISWWHFDGKEFRGCLFVPGTLAMAEGVGQMIIPGGMFEDDVDFILVTIAGDRYDLTAAYRALRSFEERLRIWAAKQAGSGWPAYQSSGPKRSAVSVTKRWRGGPRQRY